MRWRPEKGGEQPRGPWGGNRAARSRPQRISGGRRQPRGRRTKPGGGGAGPGASAGRSRCPVPDRPLGAHRLPTPRCLVRGSPRTHRGAAAVPQPPAGHGAAAAAAAPAAGAAHRERTGTALGRSRAGGARAVLAAAARTHGSFRAPGLRTQKAAPEGQGKSHGGWAGGCETRWSRSGAPGPPRGARSTQPAGSGVGGQRGPQPRRDPLSTQLLRERSPLRDVA